MNPTEYVKNVLVTESTDLEPIKARIDDRMIRLLHGGLGLSSELAELVDAFADPKDDIIDWVNIAEESGDLFWYISVIVNTLGFDPEHISSSESEADKHSLIYKHNVDAMQSALSAAVWCTGNYNDLLKKHLFYGRELNKEKMEQVLGQLCMAVAGICTISGTTSFEARDTNIAKLRARYGDKFTEAAALNRDLETERKILEDGIKE